MFLCFHRVVARTPNYDSAGQASIPGSVSAQFTPMFVLSNRTGSYWSMEWIAWEPRKGRLWELGCHTSPITGQRDGADRRGHAQLERMPPQLCLFTFRVQLYRRFGKTSSCESIIFCVSLCVDRIPISWVLMMIKISLYCLGAQLWEY